MDHSMPALSVHHQLPEPPQTHVHWVSDAIQPLHPLSSPSPALNLSQHQGLSNESVLRIRWSKYWNFSFSISPSNEHPGLISCRIDWLDLLAVQGTLKSLLQHHSSKASILQCSAFFIVQLSHPYMPAGKTIALTRWIFAGKVMSLLFNMLSRLVTTFLLRSKRHLGEREKKERCGELDSCHCSFPRGICWGVEDRQTGALVLQEPPWAGETKIRSRAYETERVWGHCLLEKCSPPSLCIFPQTLTYSRTKQAQSKKKNPSNHPTDNFSGYKNRHRLTKPKTHLQSAQARPRWCACQLKVNLLCGKVISV